MDPREQIKSKIDIVPFITEFIPLKKMGRNFKALCPFHGEKTPSFVVSPERQIWHCFGCGKGGDCFTFLMEYEKLDFVDALRELAKRTGVKLATFSANKSDQQRQRLLEINHLASEFFHYLLVSHKAGEKARDYLRKRGIKKNIIETFKLGYAPAKWDVLHDYLTKKKSFSETELEQSGLVVVAKRQYDRFRDRLMFTLRDHRSNVVGFAGRLLDVNAKETHSTRASTELSRMSSVQAKYINTPETLLYHKGELLYGLDITKEAIKKEDLAIIVEGEFDMLSSFQEGITNVVALKGTAMTLPQVRLIRRFTQNIALSFDLDIAGDAAARRGIETADSEGLNIKIIQLTDAKDPDEAIRKNPILWKKAIKKAVSVYDFLIDSAISRFDKKTPEGKRAIANEVLPTLAQISNEIIKAHFVKRLSTELDVSEDAIVRQMEKAQKPHVVSAVQVAVVAPAAQTRQEVLEEYLIALLLQKADKMTVEKVHVKLEADLLSNPLLERILHLLMAYYEKRDTFEIDKFVKVAPKELIPAIDRLYLLDTESVKTVATSVEIERIMRELRTLLLRRKMEHVAGVLKEKEKKGEDKTIAILEKQFSQLSAQLTRITDKSQEKP